MKAVVLAGGLGTRLAEETDRKPKPMVEIGGRPILWHIMKIYSAAGINDFIICLGYKGYVIKEYFVNYFVHNSDISVDLSNNAVTVRRVQSEPWKVTLIDTGEHTMVGGRIKRILPEVAGDDAFCLTYGDGVAAIAMGDVIDRHRREGRLATVTATQPPGRYGAIRHQGNQVTGFLEKPTGESGWINGGFFVLSPKVGAYIDGDATVWEREPMERLAADQQLSVHFHRGFWHAMDTLRDKRFLEDLWEANRAPWKIW
jgi:glucose-1-phosphate cytidylyltransferase